MSRQGLFFHAHYSIFFNGRIKDLNKETKTSVNMAAFWLYLAILGATAGLAV
jgi:hypothetical protein